MPSDDVVHDRVADEHDLEHAVALDAAPPGEQLADQLVERLADRRRQLRARRRGSSSRTTPGSSGPRRSGSAGSSARPTASTSPVARSHRWPAIVVEPTSTATPYARRRRSRARRPTIASPAAGGVVRRRPSRHLRRRRAARCIDGQQREWSRRALDAVLVGDRRLQRAGRTRPRRRAGPAAPRRSTGGTTGRRRSRRPRSRSLRTTWPVHLAGRRARRRRRRRRSVRAQPSRLPGDERAVAVVVGLDRRRRTERVGCGVDRPLGEAADARRHLAAPADAAPAAHRVEVDAELAGRLEHRGAVGDLALEARRREHDAMQRGHGLGRAPGGVGPPPAPTLATAALAGGALGSRLARIHATQSRSLPASTSAAITADFTSGCSGFMIADVIPAPIAMARNVPVTTLPVGQPEADVGGAARGVDLELARAAGGSA